MVTALTTTQGAGGHVEILTSDGTPALALLADVVASGTLTALARVNAQNGSGQIIASGGINTPITGWTEVFDTANAFDPVTGTFIAPAAGFYLVNASLTLNAVVQASNVFLGVLLNGVAQIQANGPTPATGGNVNNGAVAVNALVRAAAGDAIRIGMTQFTGSAISLFVSAAFSGLSITQQP